LIGLARLRRMFATAFFAIGAQHSVGTPMEPQASRAMSGIMEPEGGYPS
jgi:hypothetical protein